VPKQSPFYLNRPKATAIDFTFQDRRTNPENAFVFTFRKLTTLDVLSYLERAEEYVKKYITGYGEEGKTGWQPPQPLPPVNGEIVTVSPSTCRILACIEMAQVQPEADRYRFDELAAMTVVPAIGEQMLAAYAAIQPLGEDEEAEDPTKGPTDSSSTSASVGSSATQS
jgi:hypothetical protein